MRSSTALAVLSALCAVAAVLIPDPTLLLNHLARFRRSGGGGGGGWWRRAAGLSVSHPVGAADGSQAGGGGGCPLGFGGSGDNNAASSSSSPPPFSPFSPSSTVPILELRTWYVGAGGGWTGAVEEDQEGPLWLERGGGFSVDGAGDVAEVAATAAEAQEGVERDERAGLLSGPPRQLAGAFVLPGFVDPHVHLIPAGLALTSHADLREARSRDEFEAGVAAAARRLLRQEAGGERSGDCSNGSTATELPWLMGGWWDESRWRSGSDGGGGATAATMMPTAAWIDAALERAARQEEEGQGAGAGSGSTQAASCLRALPVLLSRMDGHMAVANRVALRHALLRERERRRQQQEGAAAEEGEAAAAKEAGARELLASARAILGSDDAEEAQSSSSNRFVDAEKGLVREAGLLAVARAAPPPTLAARRAALAAATARLLASGVTAVGDMGRSPFAGGDPRASWDDLEELYDPAAAAAVAAEAEAGGGRRGGGGGSSGKGSGGGRTTPLLPLRVAAYLPLETWPRLAARVAARGSVTGPLHAAGVKLFWDGSLGSRTALMTEPYAEEEADEGEEWGDGGASGGSGGGGGNRKKPNTTNRGVRMVDSPEEAARAMSSADTAGLQPAVHAIGDAAVDEATAALAAVARARAASSGGDRPPPLRLEHVQHISGDAAARRLADLAASSPPGGDEEEGGEGASAANAALVAVINPQHLVSDAKLLSALPPAMRAAGANRTHPWRALLRAGVPLAIGSDWPIVDLDPWAGLWAAVHRRGLGERGEGGGRGGGDNGDEAKAGLTAEEALRASTAGAAFAAGLDAWCGRLVPGLKADFVLLDGSPFEEEEEEQEKEKEGRRRLPPLLARARPRVRATYVGGACRHGCGGEAPS